MIILRSAGKQFKLGIIHFFSVTQHLNFKGVTLRNKFLFLIIFYLSVCNGICYTYMLFDFTLHILCTSYQRHNKT